MHFIFFNHYVRLRQWECFIFLLANSVEALLEKVRLQRAKLETSLNTAEMDKVVGFCYFLN